MPQYLSTLRVAHVQTGRESGHTFQNGGQAPLMQDAGDIGPQLDAGTHFRQRRRFFKHLYPVPSTAACQRRSQAADARPRDQNAQGY